MRATLRVLACAAVTVSAVATSAPSVAQDTPPKEMREIRVLVACDEEFRRSPLWETKAAALVRLASEPYEAEIGVRWIHVGDVHWESDDAAETLEDLHAQLAADVPPGTADVVLGLSGQRRSGGAFAEYEFLGLANYLGRTALATMEASGATPPGDVSTVAHELGHLLGAWHCVESDTIMSSAVSNVLRFDANAREHLRLTRGFDFVRGVGSLDDTTLREIDRIWRAGHAPDADYPLAGAYATRGRARLAAGDPAGAAEDFERVIAAHRATLAARTRMYGRHYNRTARVRDSLEWFAHRAIPSAMAALDAIAPWSRLPTAASPDDADLSTVFEAPAQVAAEVAALASDDAERRSAAIGAIAQLAPEGPAATGGIVAAAAAHRDDRVWTGLEQALAQWDGETAADALSRTRASWPASARSRLDLLVHRLRVAKPPRAFPDLEASPLEIVSKVRATLASYEHVKSYSEPNPDAAAIARLGRDAIPALVEELRARDTDSKRGGSPVRVAAEALGLLAEERDLPLISHMLAAGHPSAARSLRGWRSAAALKALVVAVERDVVDWDLIDELGARYDDARVPLALAGWMERNPRNGSAGHAADIIGGAGCDAAAPVLRRVLDARPQMRPRAQIAAALARLGDPAGIEVLLDVLESRLDTWARKSAGDALNEIAGRRIFRGDYDDTRQDVVGNFDQSAVSYAAWWEGTRGRIVFDREARQWRVRGEAVARIPAGSADASAKVRAILARRDGAHSYSPSSPGVREIVNLGRDAVPELMREVRDGRGPGPGTFARRAAVTHALAQLVDASDVPLLAQFLAEGRSAAAACLVRLHSASARDALLGAVRRGFVDHDVADALRPYAREPATRKALLEWLRESRAHDPALGRVARLFAETACDEALTPLRTLLARFVQPRARYDVAAAVARLGDKEGIDALVALASSNESGAVAAASALNGIVGRRIFDGRYTSTGPSGGLAEAAAWFRRWWDESKARVRWSHSNRVWADHDLPRAPSVGTSPPEVETRVQEILARADAGDSVDSSQSRAARDLAALGRDAVPALVAHLKSGATWQEYGNRSSHAAADALRRLRTDADVPALCALMEQGHLATAASLHGCRDPRARAALLSAVARGFDDMIVVDALATTPADAATWDAVRAWLRVPGRGEGHWLAVYVEDEATPDAAPVLRELLAAGGLGSVTRIRCASALAWIGGRDGIVALLEIVEAAPARTRSNGWWTPDVTSMAAARLESFVGERVLIERDGAADALGQATTAAARRFRAWWTEHGERLRFDAARRVWRVGEPTPDRTPSCDPAMAAKVDAILHDLRGAPSFRFGSPEVAEDRDPHVRDAIALGHDAVPELVRWVRRRAPWSADHEPTGAVAAAEALVILATEDDRATMFELLAEGRLGVLAWFRLHPSSEGRDAVLGVVARGFLDYDVLRTLEPFAADARVHEALVTWMQTFGDLGDWEMPNLAEILGTPAPGTAVPVLADLLERRVPSRFRWRIAAELAKHGVKPALAALVAAFEAAPDASQGDTLQDDIAGIAVALNGLAETKLIDVTEPSRDDVFRRLGARVTFIANSGDVKDHATTVARVRAWWGGDGARLRYDADRETWGPEAEPETPPGGR